MELSYVLKSKSTARKQSARYHLPYWPSIRLRLCLTVTLLLGLCTTLGCQTLNDSIRSWNLPAPTDTSSAETNSNKDPQIAASTNNDATESQAKSTENATTQAQLTETTEDPFTKKEESPFRLDDVKAILTKPEGWIGTPTIKKEDIPWNWYHPGIEEILAWPKENGPAIHAALKKKEPVSATNAAICLARMGDRSGVSTLIGAIRSPRLKMPIRSAAAEALASFDSSIKTVQKLIDDYSDDAKLPNPNLYRELISGLARHIDAAGDQRFLDALKSSSSKVRLAAIEAWSKSQSKVLPNELIYLSSDQNDKNRTAVMHVLGTHDHPERMQYLHAGLRDINYRVRVAAIESLGQIGSQEAVDWLKEASTSKSSLVRAAVVRSLAAADQTEVAFEQAKDSAWQVRLAIAEILPQNPSEKGVQVARDLLQDHSSQVKHQTLSSIDSWPLAKSGPLLLDAIEKLSFQTRQAATSQLAKRWEPAKQFPRHAPKEVRQRAIAQLRAEFQQKFGYPDGAGSTDLANNNAEKNQAKIDPTLLVHAKRLIARHEDPRCASADRYQIRQEIRNLGKNPIAVLEHLVFKERQELPEEFFTTILPELDPTFDILYQMQEDTVQAKSIQNKAPLTRRRAASNLVRLTAEHKPSRLALDRLAELMLQESDALIWRSVLIALADNGSQPALQMVRIAIGHESPEVRRRACGWLAAHPSPNHFKLLKPALDDPSPQVKLAAVRAVVAGGKLSDTTPLKNILNGNQDESYLPQNVSLDASTPPKELPDKQLDTKMKEIEPLKKLLGDSSEELQIEVAYALAAFGDKQGPQALKQLARSRNANVRQKAAETIGRLEDPSFAPLLISLLDDRLNVRRAAMNALPKTVGHEVPAAGDRKPRTSGETIARWKEWYAHQNGSSLR